MDGSQAEPVRYQTTVGRPGEADAVTEGEGVPPTDAPEGDLGRRERALVRRIRRLRDHHARSEQELVDLRYVLDTRAAELDQLRHDLSAALDRTALLDARLRDFGDVTPEEFAARVRRTERDLAAREEEAARQAAEAEQVVAEARRQAAELLANARAEAEARIERDRRTAHRHAEDAHREIVARAENRAEAILAEAALQARRLRGESLAAVALPARPAFRTVRHGYAKGQVNNFVGWAKKAAADPASAPEPPSTEFRAADSGYEHAAVDAWVRTVLGLIRRGHADEPGTPGGAA
ncbi:hypothetical protein [Micromonospora sp. NBC_01412]|uniref:hypothetical protein n=1 Tax=Micromonospora sp. NBC_01412 TaxID=2903590 RepID=UPI003250E9FC